MYYLILKVNSPSIQLLQQMVCDKYEQKNQHAMFSKFIYILMDVNLVLYRKANGDLCTGRSRMQLFFKIIDEHWLIKQNSHSCSLPEN